MRTRITVTDLRAAVALLNTTTGNTPGAVGSYVLCGAYGGWQLQRLANASGGVRQITYGYIPARELWERIHCVRFGYEQAAYERACADLGREPNGSHLTVSTHPEADACPVTGDTYGIPA